MADRLTADDIEAEAARWVLRLDAEERSPALEAELRHWLAADSRRQGALLFAQASWRMLDKIGTEPSAAEAVERTSPMPPRGSRLPRRRVLGVMTGLAASMVGIAIFPWGEETYRTGVGEIRRVPLPDQSVAAINTASRVKVRYTEKRRVVTLAQGEAWFRVASSPARPFVVEAGSIRVQAVGTAFAVRRRLDGVEVLVTEGVVRAWTEGREGEAARLEAGTRAFVAYDAKVPQRFEGQGEVDRRLAWREGLIDLSGQTLSEAAAEFNRYNTRRILIEDEALGAERLYGVFRTDDPQGFARAAATSLRVGAHGTPSGDIIIEGRQVAP